MQGGQKLTAPAAGVCLLFLWHAPVWSLPSKCFWWSTPAVIQSCFSEEKINPNLFYSDNANCQILWKNQSRLEQSLQFGKAFPQCICVLSETAYICTMILLFLWDLTKKNILLLDDGRFRSACYNQRKIMQQCVAVNMLCDLGNPTCLRHMIWLTLPIENPSQI